MQKYRNLITGFVAALLLVPAVAAAQSVDDQQRLFKPGSGGVVSAREPSGRASPGNAHFTTTSDGRVYDASKTSQSKAGVEEATGPGGEPVKFTRPFHGTAPRPQPRQAEGEDARYVPPAREGDVSIGRVIGSDDRKRNTPTTGYPHSAIVFITTSTGTCTGWLIGADTVATAGHCVYDNGAWGSNYHVYPGRDGSTLNFQTCHARTLYTVVGWKDYGRKDYDYGAIKLDCTVGYNTGWFGYQTHLMDSGFITGYPTAPEDQATKPYGTQWWHSGPLTLDYATAALYIDGIDTSGGQSGSPVWRYNSYCGSVCGYGIHHGWDGRGNLEVRISHENGSFDNLTSWKNS